MEAFKTINEKILNEIAFFVQDLLKDKPMKYSEVREEVCKKFNLSKVKAGNILHTLNRRSNFLSLTFKFESLYNGVLYLPDYSSEARQLFRTIRNGIPQKIRWVNRRLHDHLLSEARKIKLQNPELPADLLAQVLGWKLKINKTVAKRLIGELQ